MYKGRIIISRSPAFLFANLACQERTAVYIYARAVIMPILVIINYDCVTEILYFLIMRRPFLSGVTVSQVGSRHSRFIS